MRLFFRGFPLRRFNSRTREGCDACILMQLSQGIVSIHAPARGAITLKGFNHGYKSFNSRTREGCDALPA